MRVGVIGGGVSGLTAAYRLKQRGAAVELFEGSARVGGLLGTQRFDGFVVETGPDSILTDKPWAMQLAEELGLGGEIIATEVGPRGAYIVHQGKLARVPDGFSLMAPTDLLAMARSPILTWPGKLRMACDLVLPARKSGGDESLHSFVVRRLGREALDRLAQPLVGGIYGADPRKLSLSATMPRFVEMEQERGSVIRGMWARAKKQDGAAKQGTSGARYGLFAAFRGGMQTFVDALSAALAGAIYTEHPVSAIEQTPRGVQIEVRGALRSYDALVVAVPAHAASRLLAHVDAQLAQKLSEIVYASAATVSCIWPRSAIAHALDAYGFVVPSAERREILASTWASVKWAGRAPPDKALIRVFIGGYAGQQLLERGDDELLGIALRELKDLMGIMKPPEWSCVLRYPRAMPQYYVGHLQRVAEIEARVAKHPRIALAGNAYRGVGIPDAVRSGNDAAAKLLASSFASYPVTNGAPAV